MKYLFVLLLCLFMSSLNAQCEYNLVKYDNSTDKVYIQLSPITLDVYQTPFNARIVLANLIRNGDQYFIEIDITKDSAAKDLEPICFEKGDRLSFSLKNNTIINISQIDEKICGVKFKDRKSEYTTVSNYAKFIITQHAFDEMIKSEVVLMKITSQAYNKTFVIREELKENKDEEIVITNPSRFFIDNIKCLTNPNFE